MRGSFVSVTALAALVAAGGCTRKDTPAADSPSGPGVVSTAAAADKAGQPARADAAAETAAPRFVG
ncbi:MAG: hypothetical protein KIS78_12415, partial [Labilithrix sp.]|nr:hypothetical protein [Labilithrix sp.]